MIIFTKCKSGVILFLFCLFFLNNCAAPVSEEHSNTETPKNEPQSQLYTVEIKGMKFVPDTITVEKGDTIVFVNRDMVAHCVTEEKSNAWTSSSMPSGEAYMHIVKESADYYCAIHKVMKGKIIMK